MMDFFRAPNCTQAIHNDSKLAETRQPFSKIVHHHYWS